MTCQTLLGLEDASKSKPQLVSPMFKGMEGRSMHVIEIIKNGCNPTDCPERIFFYQPSWSFGVLIAFSNSVLCLSDPNACMSHAHVDRSLASGQSSC